MAASKYFKLSVSRLSLSSLLVFHALGFLLQRLKSLEIIKESTVTVYSLKKMHSFPLVIFIPILSTPFLICLAISSWEYFLHDYTLQQQHNRCLDLFDMDGLIHFGISGNLNSSMNIGDVMIIPNQFVNFDLWDWLKPNAHAQVPKNDFATLEVKEYNVPRGGNRMIGIGYRTEQFYSDAGEVWLQLASALQGVVELEECEVKPMS